MCRDSHELKDDCTPKGVLFKDGSGCSLLTWRSPPTKHDRDQESARRITRGKGVDGGSPLPFPIDEGFSLS